MEGINVKEIMNRGIEEAFENVKAQRKKYVVTPKCDATEAQERRKLLEKFKLTLAKKRVEFQVNIQDSGKTIPELTNEAYCQLDDVFAEINKVFDKLIGLEKQNIMDGE